MRPLLLATLALLAACPGGAHLSGSGAATVPVWGRFEHVFEADAAPHDEVVVAFSAPSGGEQTARAFWDGGRVWRVRFMPDAPGTWRFRAPAHGVEGRFEAASAGTDNPLYRHGALRVSADRTHFVHADGTPFFWLGDTAWNGALRATPADWAAYLDRRRAQRYSGIQFVTTPWRTALADADGQVAYTVEGGALRVNPAFFQRMDAYVEAINARGLVAAPVVLWALGDADEMPVPGKLPEEQAITLARYITARYGAHHVWWFLAGDDNVSRRGDYWRTVGRAVFGEGTRAPVTLHQQGMQWHMEAYRDEPWLDSFIYQSGHGDDDRTLAWIHSGPVAESWRNEPVRPIINSEPPYEGHLAYQSRQPHSAYTVRRAVYWSLMNAPTAGVSYGGHGIWSWETTPTVPLNHDNSGTARPWHEAVEMEGSADMEHVAALFTRLPWWRLRPAQGLLARQPGRGDPARFVSVARSIEEDVAVLYLPVGGWIELREAVGDEAVWFDPRTGVEAPATPEAVHVYRAPDERDWVLVLR